MKKAIAWLAVFALLAAAVIGFYVWRQGPNYQAPAAAPPLDTPPPPVTASEPEIRYPVVEAPAPALPTLDNSDSTVLAALAEVLGKSAVRQFLQPQEIVRRIVATIDNLPRKNMSGQLLPNKPVSGRLRTSGDGEQRVLASANDERYRAYVRLFEAIDAEKFGAAYRRLYPLFQKAYRDLGYPKGHFNDRLVAVIDHLLQAPRTEGPVALVQPHLFYKFADPELEALSVGHKLMLRIGNDNADRVKAKLRELRNQLTKEQ
jgi:hypothetical protein